MNKTSALPLALVYVATVVYASLYPFADWRAQGIAPWAFLVAPLPRYWTAFDLLSNVMGYLPVGFLLALTALRRGRRVSAANAFFAGLALGMLLSLTLESLQSYLPERVPSNLDLVLNTLGSGAGAALACLLDRGGATAHWSRLRDRWFDSDAQGVITLLALWPVALMFPAAVPMGLGRVLERLENSLAEWTENTPFIEWIPVRYIELQPLVPGVEMLCVALGLLVPCLLGYSAVTAVGRRLAVAGLVTLFGMGASALSASLSFGPAHAWAWLSTPAQLGLGLGLGLALLLAPAPRRLAQALLLVALSMHLAIVNQTPENAYFAQTLQTWEQGRFIRFHGLMQWLGWLWPFGAMAYALGRSWRR